MFEMITEMLQRGGYLGVFALMALENIFPPIPSELIMPFAGYVAARGELHVVGVLLAGTAGSVAGALPWYYAGRRFGKERLDQMAGRHARWLTITHGDIARAMDAFERHGRKVVLLGRLVPAIRTLISVPAGLARMHFGEFLLYSTIGSLIWTSLLTGAGYLLESQYARVAEYVDPVSTAVLAALVLWYLYRLVTFRTSHG